MAPHEAKAPPEPTVNDERWSTENVWREIRGAEAYRDSILASFKYQKSAYHGPYLKGNKGRTETGGFDGESNFQPNNHAFQYIAWMLPQLVYHNPKSSVKSAKTGATEQIAKAHKHGLDRWARDEKLSERLQMLATDFLMNYGVARLSVEDHPARVQIHGKHKGKAARRPVFERIPQDRFIRDPQATSEAGIEFAGHSWLSTRDELLDRAHNNPDEGWNIEVIEQLSEGVGVSEQFKSRDDDMWDIDRKQFAIYDVWIKDLEDDDHPGPEEGYHGTILTLALDKSDDSDPKPQQVRDPRPFYGRPEGPYHIADVYPVSNEPARLSPLLAIEAQSREWNRLSRGINQSAADYKRLVLVSGVHDDLVDQITSGEHDLVLPVPGFDKNDVLGLEVGGITNEMLLTESRAKEIVDRASGFNEAAQGQVSGNSTATEAALVDQNSSVRTDFVLLRFQQFVASVFEAVSRYFWYDEEIQFSLGPESNGDLGIEPGEEAWFVGGDHDPERGLTFEDLEFDIEPLSMKRISEASQQQTANAVLTGAQMIGQGAAMQPWVDWRKIAEQWGDAYNLPDFADTINYDLAAAIGTQMMMQGAAFGEEAKPSLESQSGPKLPQAPQTPNSTQLSGMGGAAGQQANSAASTGGN